MSAERTRSGSCCALSERLPTSRTALQRIQVEPLAFQRSVEAQCMGHFLCLFKFSVASALLTLRHSPSWTIVKRLSRERHRPAASI